MAGANVRKRKVQKIFQQKEACKSPSMRRIVVPDQSVPLPQVEEDYVPPERKGVTVALGRKSQSLMRIIVQDQRVPLQQDTAGLYPAGA